MAYYMNGFDFSRRQFGVNFFSTIVGECLCGCELEFEWATWSILSCVGHWIFSSLSNGVNRRIQTVFTSIVTETRIVVELNITHGQATLSLWFWCIESAPPKQAFEPNTIHVWTARASHIPSPMSINRDKKATTIIHSWRCSSNNIVWTKTSTRMWWWW